MNQERLDINPIGSIPKGSMFENANGNCGVFFAN